MSFTLDWHAIRPFNGSQANGFEQLCTQLAEAERPPGSHFERKGTPDAGVECYAVLSNEAEWGWQAKYIDNLGESQWPGIDSSVQTALDKHPKLVRYYVCAPLDRPDARILDKSGNVRKSAKERWDDHVLKWGIWASNRGMSVEFIWWGSHELLDRLSRPEHVGRVYFWFGVRGFDQAWFQARLDEAIKTAGPRYTPELHIELPIAADLEAFSRTESFFNRVKMTAREIRTRLRSLVLSQPKEAHPPLDLLDSAISEKTQVVLNELGAVTLQPVGKLPFERIAGLVLDAEASAAKLGEQLSSLKEEPETAGVEKVGAEHLSSHRQSTIPECRRSLDMLHAELRKARQTLERATAFADNSLLILKGVAGTGKTHLLCDIAKGRLANNQPTVLLIGQQFISLETPWAQAVQQLDLPGLSAEMFVGALEAAAQAAGCRALLLVDAINEGAGRELWPNHLAAFLAHLERSSWIGVVVSVRSSYEELIIPEEVRARAVNIVHQGFAGREYDAIRSFFIHYGLELPSTPLLAPEFTNPLFLKTLCQGLRDTGQRRLPRGHQGITAAFGLYLNAINKRLSKALSYNPKQLLVRNALLTFSRALVDSNTRWLTLREAEDRVNALLPGREFERSLYRGLVTEGLLIEEMVWQTGSNHEEVVLIAYERLADHIVASILLDTHLNEQTPDETFASGGPLAFLWDGSQYVTAGLLEAICVQVPERTRREFVSLIPDPTQHSRFEYPFLQSLVWRDQSTFSDETGNLLSSFIQRQPEKDHILDIVLTLATLPGHPLNADYLDRWLRGDDMPTRDSYWSIFLHHSWGTRGAVDRIVDWASVLSPDLQLDEDTVELCGTALAWMFTSSNRFLRDRATKALVNLYSGRLDAVLHLLEKFMDVDDPYVRERVYAVAYGVATRSYDSKKVGTLAQFIYCNVFEKETPPPHILLRDYARGIIERAAYLGAQIDADIQRTRPPYGGEWPKIPTDEDVKPFLPDYSQVSHDGGQLEWAANRIGTSVLNDDFAHYVIGDNWGSSNWLSLRLSDAAWQSLDERKAALVKEFSDLERVAWEAFTAAEEDAKRLSWQKRHFNAQNAIDNDSDEEPTSKEVDEDPEWVSAVQRVEASISALGKTLTEEHKNALEELFDEEHDVNARRPPYFDLQAIKRYVLYRVFELGWTIDLFAHFDRFSIGYHGRDAAKPERIGKKYQWIAYHEIMALVADNFQYRDRYDVEEGGGHAYQGPWQESFRDIDPTCTLRATRGGTSFSGHSPAWWAPARYDGWETPEDPREWAVRREDLPEVKNFLRVVHPNDGTWWLDVDSFLSWSQQPPPDREFGDAEHRDLWYMCTGYLVKSEEVDTFMKWAEGISFYGRWMPEPGDTHRMFLGEHCWSSASRYFQEPYENSEGWRLPGKGCPVRVRLMSAKYSSSMSGFDCSADDSFTLHLPSCDLISGLDLRWTGRDAEYVDSENRVAVFDPTARSEGPSALLIREDLLKAFLERECLSLIWIVLGEKMATSPGLMRTRTGLASLTGAYTLKDGELVGFLKLEPEHGDSDLSDAEKPGP